MTWILAHDLRLAWRDVRATFHVLDSRALSVLLAVLFVVVHAVAWPIAGRFGEAEATADPAALIGAAAPKILFILLLMVAQTLNGATKLLYTRGDLDLLFSSPLSTRKILFARALAVALGAMASAAIFVVPLADTGALDGHPRMLAFYPALLGGALLAAVVGLTIVLGLFALMGPRLTRLAAQILATVIGAGFVIGLQVRHLLPSVSLGSAASRWLEASGWPAAALTLPVRAALGQPWALAGWLLITSGLFGAVVLVFGRRFAASACAASSAGSSQVSHLFGPSVGGQPAATIPAALFRGGALPALRKKEWRLIARDPWVVSQILLQILYMTPMIALLWSGGGSIALALGPMVVVITFQVASSLTWLGLCGEDAPDLLGTSPLPAAVLKRGKLEAVGALTLAVVALPLLWLAFASPAAAACAFVVGAFGLCAAVQLQSWHGRPAKRSAFARRHRESKLVALVETVMSMLLGVGTALAVLGSGWCVGPLLIVVVVLFCLRPSGTRPLRRAKARKPVPAEG